MQLEEISSCVSPLVFVMKLLNQTYIDLYSLSGITIRAGVYGFSLLSLLCNFPRLFIYQSVFNEKQSSFISVSGDIQMDNLGNNSKRISQRKLWLERDCV